MGRLVDRQQEGNRSDCPPLLRHRAGEQVGMRIFGYYFKDSRVCSVPVTIIGGPTAVETKEMPRHKKNPAIGTKKTVYASEIIIEQQDARALAMDEEVGIFACAIAY